MAELPGLREMEIVGIRLDSADDIKIKNEENEIKVELPLCFRDPKTGEITCTGKYIATYRKGFIGPVELKIVRPT